MKKITTASALVVLLSIVGCIEPQQSYTKLPPGIWRGVLYLNPGSEVSAVGKEEFQYKSESEGELPFNFEIAYNDSDDLILTIHNGTEKIIVDDVTFGRDKASARDTVRIDFPVFDSHIRAEYEDRVLEGYWTLHYKQDYRIQFKATYGDSIRFKKGIQPPDMDLTGKYQVRFEMDTESEYPAVAHLNQNGAAIEGTFQTETGDYRFLEGSVVGNKMYLSCFDGAHAFLFEAKDLGDGKLNGIFKSGIHYTASWIGEKSDQTGLPDAYSLSKVEDAQKPFSFDLTDTEGNNLTLQAERFSGKNKIIVVMGSWCPNCKDATDFLKELKADPLGSDLEIVSIGFERYKDAQKNLAQLKRYKEKSGISWPVVLGGYFSKKEASEVIQNIDQIISYPTLIVLDKDNIIRAIYTGFSGPATDEYPAFKETFYAKIKKLQTGE